MPRKTLEARREYRREYMRKWRAANPERRAGKTYQERLEYHREYAKKNKDRMAPRKKAYYEANKDYFKQKSLEHYRKNKERIATKGAELRARVIHAYGDKCVCCGETEPKFLALDHKNNDGVHHRKIAKGHMCKWAEDNGYPDLLQLLCHNCNLAKAFYGRCPHNDRTEPESNSSAPIEILSAEMEG